jgi:hypothetical protein
MKVNWNCLENVAILDPADVVQEISHECTCIWPWHNVLTMSVFVSFE